MILSYFQELCSKAELVKLIFNLVFSQDILQQMRSMLKIYTHQFEF